MEHTLNYAVKDLTGKELEYRLNNFLSEIEGEIRKIARTERRGLERFKYFNKALELRNEIEGIEKVLGCIDLTIFLRETVNSLLDYIKGKEKSIFTMFFVVKGEETYQKTMSFTPEQIVDARKDIGFSMKLIYTSEEYLKFKKYFHPDWSVEEEEEF